MSKEIIQDRSVDLTGVGGIKFSEAEHTYHNANGDRYTGITTLLGNYHDHFDSERTSFNKAIKDCVIQFFGEQKYNDKMNSSNGASVIREIYDNMPAWLLDPIVSASIKEVVTEELGEENYLKLEKQVRGQANLAQKLPKFKESKPELYEKLMDNCVKNGVITQFGLDNYKKLTKTYDGFDNILKAAPGIEKKYPTLYENIKVKREWLKEDWIATNLRATTEGTIEHDRREQEIYDDGGYEWRGTFYKFVKGKNISNVTMDDVIVIPECMVWNHEMKLGGLADIFLFDKGTIYVLDYKTNATIDIKPKIANKKYHTMMTGVCSALHDLNFYHYSLQLKIYQLMAIMIRPEFSAGENIIIHTTSDTHYRYEDKHYDCFDVEDIVPMVFQDVKDKLK